MCARLSARSYGSFTTSITCFEKFRFRCAWSNLDFPTMMSQNAHFYAWRSFRQEKPHVANNVANYAMLCAVQDVQCKTEESP